MKIVNADKYAKQLRDQRTAAGMTLAQAAQKAGISPFTLIRLEHARTGYVRNKTAIGLQLMPANHAAVVAKEAMDGARTSDTATKRALLALRTQLDKLLLPNGVERRKGSDRRATVNV